MVHVCNQGLQKNSKYLSIIRFRFTYILQKVQTQAKTLEKLNVDIFPLPVSEK